MLAPVPSAHPQLAATEPIYDSSRRAPSFWEEVVELWRYRELVQQLVTRDIKVRYKRSVLGVAWTMLNPLLMMLVLTVVFSHLFRYDLPHYPVYLLSAVVLWNFFTQSTTASMNGLLAAGSLVNKIYVPKTVFGLAAIGTGLVNIVLSLVPLLAIMLVVGLPLTPALLILPLPILLTALFALGLGLALSTLAVTFYDIVDMYQIVTSAWFFVTPIIYPPTILPEQERWWLYLNPMYYLVETFRAPIYAGTLPEPLVLLVAVLVALVMLVIGWVSFTGQMDKIAYHL